MRIANDPDNRYEIAKFAPGRGKTNDNYQQEGSTDAQDTSDHFGSFSLRAPSGGWLRTKFGASDQLIARAATGYWSARRAQGWLRHGTRRLNASTSALSPQSSRIRCRRLSALGRNDDGGRTSLDARSGHREQQRCIEHLRACIFQKGERRPSLRLISGRSTSSPGCAFGGLGRLAEMHSIGSRSVHVKMHFLCVMQNRLLSLIQINRLSQAGDFKSRCICEVRFEPAHVVVIGNAATVARV
jgi:hypothetical protein